MNRQIQIELWPECRCHRCKFCNLVLSSEMRGSGKQSNPNILLGPDEKNIFLYRAITFIDTIDWSKYDTLLIRGGEVFNAYPQSIVSSFTSFINKIAKLIHSSSIQKLFLVTSLKYDFDTSLLKLTLELLAKNGIALKDRVLVGTSWDATHRFDKASLTHWYNCEAELNKLGVPMHVTSILTQSFIDSWNCQDSTILSLMDGDFDFIAAQGKPELLHLPSFFPNRSDCLKFLTELKNSKYSPVWHRLLHQEYRRAETIYFTEHDKLHTRDLATFREVLENDQQTMLTCGHPAEYANYADSDACFLCDINTLSKVN